MFIMNPVSLRSIIEFVMLAKESRGGQKIHSEATNLIVHFIKCCDEEAQNVSLFP